MSTPAYPVGTIAKLFNLTERRVQQLASDGVIPKADRGKYDLVACVRGYIAFLQDRAFGKEVIHADAHQERARLLKAQADKTELEVKTLKGELIPSDEVAAEWAGLVVAFRSRLLVLPTRGAHLATGLKEFHEIESGLRELVHEALNELSLHDPQTIGNPDFQDSEISSAAPALTVSQWADRHRQLSSEASAEPGRWNTNRAPYQRAIMDALCDPRVETVVIMSSAQIGKTEIINNIIGYHVHLDPSPILLLQPTLEMAEAWSKDRFAPMLRDTEVLRGLVKDPRTRDSGNTLLHKRFPGGHITMAGANSPASLASRPIRLVLCDEVDRYPASAGTEGDPVSLAKKRTTTFWNRKLLLTSTPTIKGVSRIEAAFEQSDQRRYHVPCPQCGEYQTLKWAQVKWDSGDNGHKPETAHYICEHNGCVIVDSDRPAMLKIGRWVAEQPLAGIAGFHINELYSPWVTFAQIVTDFLRAKALPETLKTWVNTSLGEPWEEDGETIEADVLLNRKEGWGSDAPEQVVLVTAGVDVQGDRLEIEVKGWGIGEECWSLDYRIFYGDPAQDAVWRELDAYLLKPILSKTGVHLNIACVCVDSGGHHTQAVYEFCASRAMRGVFAVKGINQMAKPLLGRPSKNNRYRLRLYPIGTDTAKEVIYSRLRITEPGAGYFHFPLQRDREYFLQLTGEKQVTRFTKGVARREWIKIRSRNEALDCTVYALAAFKLLNPDLAQLAEGLERAPRIMPEADTTETTNSKPHAQWIPRMDNWLSR